MRESNDEPMKAGGVTKMVTKMFDDQAGVVVLTMGSLRRPASFQGSPFRATVVSLSASPAGWSTAALLKRCSSTAEAQPKESSR